MRKQELHPRTAVLNNVQKNHSKKARLEALVWLAEQFPLAFDNELRIRPLKAGIMEDILLHADAAAKAGISKSKLREAVVLFTRRLDYLACLKTREMRIDLEGHAVVAVTEEEAEHAAVKIKKRVEKSARNARKYLAEKSTLPGQNSMSAPGFSTVKAGTEVSGVAADYLPIYPSRGSSYKDAIAPTPPVKASSVIVKHKTTRAYDPSAVARLKEKLGLSRGTLAETKEAVE